MKRFNLLLCKWFGHKFYVNWPLDRPHLRCARCGVEKNWDQVEWSAKSGYK